MQAYLPPCTGVAPNIVRNWVIRVCQNLDPEGYEKFIAPKQIVTPAAPGRDVKQLESYFNPINKDLAEKSQIKL